MSKCSETSYVVAAVNGWLPVTSLSQSRNRGPASQREKSQSRPGTLTCSNCGSFVMRKKEMMSAREKTESGKTVWHCREVRLKEVNRMRAATSSVRRPTRTPV